MAGRRGPPSGAPPAYTYVTRVYKRSLRPIVLAMALVAALWSLAFAVAGYRELATDENDNFHNLAPLAAVQGTLYTLALLFQGFGIAAVATQRTRFIRMFTYLSALTSLFAVGVSFMRVITHFTFKIRGFWISHSLRMGVWIRQMYGFWTNNPGSNLDATDAATYCNDAWSHDSWAEILLLVLLIVVGLLFTSTAFAYYRQVIDPTSPVNSSRTPANQVRMDDFPAYHAPYDAPAYAPPAGPPPFDGEGKPPQYNYGAYSSFGDDKGKEENPKNDPFSDYVTPPMPTHWAEERDVTSGT
ncbi:hypothetical protein EV401DRAFT_203077 [Pisolithus croceorrhizus]|nr:hypothetical protein EV401DRAFT_203077 [Pisolithus croceorrhizus]